VDESKRRFPVTFFFTLMLLCVFVCGTENAAQESKVSQRRTNELEMGSGGPAERGDDRSKYRVLGRGFGGNKRVYRNVHTRGDTG